MNKNDLEKIAERTINGNDDDKKKFVQFIEERFPNYDEMDDKLYMELWADRWNTNPCGIADGQSKKILKKLGKCPLPSPNTHQV